MKIIAKFSGLIYNKSDKIKGKIMNKFNKSQKSLIAVHMLKMVMDLFISIFLTSYILSQTPNSILGQGLVNIGIFYLSWYIVYGIFEFICSFFVDKGNRLAFLRIAIVINTLLIIALVFWGEQISHWLIPAGAICGLIDAFYYSSYLVVRTEVAGDHSLDKFSMMITILTNVIKVIVPVILGYIIDTSTLSSIAIYIVIISIVQFIISLFIKVDKNLRSKFEFKKFLDYLKTNQSDAEKLKFTYLSSLPSGFRATYNSLVVILTVYIFASNTILGACTSVFALLTIICLMLFKMADNNKKINKCVIYVVLGFLPLASAIVASLITNKITLIILNFLLTLSTYFSDYLGNLERDAIIEDLHKEEFFAEHQVLNEEIQVIGRVLAFATYIFVGLSSNFVIFLIMLISFMAFNPFKFLVMYKQRLIRRKIENLD